MEARPGPRSQSTHFHRTHQVQDSATLHTEMSGMRRKPAREASPITKLKLEQSEGRGLRGVVVGVDAINCGMCNVADKNDAGAQGTVKIRQCTSSPKHRRQ